MNKGQRGRKGKMEERSSEEYNLITSRESAGYGGRGEGAALCQSIRCDWEQQREVLDGFYTSEGWRRDRNLARH